MRLRLLLYALVEMAAYHHVIMALPSICSAIPGTVAARVSSLAAGIGGTELRALQLFL